MKKRGLIIDELYFTNYIMSSDDDAPIVQELAVGIDENMNLIIAIDNIDYDEPEYNCSTYALVTTENALRLARRFKVALSELPAFIADCMDGWNEIVNPNFKQVQECFKIMTDCLIDDGCRFTIRRTFGPGGFCCC